MALGAKVKLVSASGQRVISAEKFFVSPQNESSRETALLPNEILTEIQVPAAHGVKNATYEIRQKEALDWPLVTASVAIQMQGSNVGKAVIVLGHVAPTPWYPAKASEALNGKPLTPETIAQAADLAADGATPLSGNDYKVKLAKVAVRRALLEASGKG
jgi:xanthine dehydrogenase YagS FAD-binding subunit